MIIRHLHIIQRNELTEVKCYEHSYQVEPALRFWIPTMKRSYAERKLVIDARIKKAGATVNSMGYTIRE